MKQVSLGLIVIMCLSFPIPVKAQTPTDSYVLQLVELGYSDVRISRTFLGRYKILASRSGVTRELIVARNGQILFDYLDAARREGSSSTPALVDGNFSQPALGAGNVKDPAKDSTATP